MITPNSAKRGVDIAMSAAYQGKYLAPEAQSPLSGLVESISGISKNGHGTVEEIVGLSDQLNTSTGTHGELQKSIVQNVSRIMSTIISVARNDVNPKIKEVLAVIEADRAVYADAASSTDKVIVQMEVPALFTDTLFVELIAPYTSIIRGLPSGDEGWLYQETLSAIADGLTVEEVATLVQTGSVGLDDRVTAVIGNGSNLTRGIVDEAMNTRRSLSEMTASFMALTGLLNDRLEKASSLITDGGEAHLAHIRQVLGFEINKMVDRLTNAVKNNMLIASPLITGSDNLKENEVIVVGPVYRNWLKELGGSPEAVIGYGITVQQRYNPSVATALYNDPAKFVKTYERQRQHGKALSAVEDVNIVTRAITKTVSKQVRDTYSETAEVAEGIKRLTTCMEKRYHGSIDVVNYVRDVICKVFTEGDDVRTILVEIDNALERMGDEPDMKQAVFIATNRLVGKWVAKQIAIGE